VSKEQLGEKKRLIAGKKLSRCGKSWIACNLHQFMMGLQVVKIMGGPAHTGLQSRWSWPWPQAEILPPEHHLCLHLRWLGQHGFFLHAHREPLSATSQKGGSLSDCLSSSMHWPSWPPFSCHFSHIFSILIMATSELHHLSQFLKRHRPPFFIETLDSYNYYNHKRGIGSTTLSKGGGMESRWIGSCRHYQSGLRCANIPSLVNKFLTHL
jgi:hypothetical protein